MHYKNFGINVLKLLLKRVIFIFSRTFKIMVLSINLYSKYILFLVYVQSWDWDRTTDNIKIILGFNTSVHILKIDIGKLEIIL